LVTSRAALAGNDFIDWGTLGLASNTGIPQNPFSILSSHGVNVTVGEPSGNLTYIVEGQPGPQFWNGNFTPGDHLLDSGIPSNRGPMTISFPSPVLGGGAQIENDPGGPFVASIAAFDATGTLLGSFTEAGQSSFTTTAIFLGIRSDSANIAKIQYSIVSGPPDPRVDFAINQFDFYAAASPDIVPTSLAWNPTKGGVDFSYKVTGGPLPEDTTAQLYWASGTTTDAILKPATTPVTIPKVVPVDQVQSVHLAPTDFLGSPAPGATNLLAVVDPDNKIAEGTTGEINNVLALAYDPQITVVAKYDGDPSDAGMGRFFAGTNALADNFYTVKLSDSLDALRPQVQVKVGNQVLDTSASPNVADTVVTGAFDPGSLQPGSVPLEGEALIQGQDISDFMANVLVEPLPNWVLGLAPPTPGTSVVTFDPNGAGPGAGAYVFDGLLPELSVGGAVFTVPASVPLVGGKDVKATAGFEVSAIAPLAVSSTPTLQVGLQTNLTLGDSITLFTMKVAPTAGREDDDSSFTITSGATLDPITLNEANGFSLTLAYDTKKPKALQTTLYETSTIVFPFGVPVALQFDVSTSLDVMLHAHAQIAFDATNGLELLPAGTFLGVGATGSLTATGQGGWFAPAWVKNILGRFSGGFPIPSLTLKDTATLSLSLNAEAHLGGSIGALQATGLKFTGTATFSDKLDLVFTLFKEFDVGLFDLTKPLYTWTYP
jgi:hypothetical protein